MDSEEQPKDADNVLKPYKGAYFVKWLEKKYYPQISELECYSCENFWSEDDLKVMMTKCEGLVIDFVNIPVAFVVYDRDSDEKQITILNIVVHPDHRRKGLGKLLIKNVLARLNADVPEAMFYVRESNLGGHLFLKNCGFLALGIVKNHFKDDYPEQLEQEDAIRFYCTQNMADDVE